MNVLRRPFVALSLLPLLVMAADFVIRYSYLRVLEPALLQHFFFSLLFEWTLWFMAAWTVSTAVKRRTIAVAAGAMLIAAAQVLVYGHYAYFGVIPNLYSVNYALTHSADTLALAASSATWKHAGAFIAMTALYAALLANAAAAVDTLRPRTRYAAGAAFVLLTLVFNNNVRFVPASYSFSPATLFSVKYALAERWGGTMKDVHRGYVRRRCSVAERPPVRARYNVVLFVGESLRRTNLSAYGHSRPTSPFLDNLVAAGSVVRFDRHVANAVSTQFSVPMLLSGTFTITRPDQPYIYDLLRRWTDARTSFFTSQSMQRSNIDLIYNTSLDTFVCQEGLPFPPANDLGADDAAVGELVNGYMARHTGGRFFTVVQFNNTHYPYTVKPGRAPFTSPEGMTELDRYDNTVLDQDEVVRGYMLSLHERGLLDSTVILFTADHGEAFGERGHRGHLNTLYGEEVDVPMWMYLPPGFPPEARKSIEAHTTHPTSHLDIVPTLLDLYGLDDGRQRGAFDGVSWLRPVPPGRVIPLVGKDMIDTKAVIAAPYKFIETVQNGVAAYEAYDVTADPGERTNRWTALTPEQRRRAQELLKEADRRATAEIPAVTVR